MSIFKPMLAAKLEDADNLRFPVLASPKLDGIRALVINGILYSRNIKPIPNSFLQVQFSRNALSGLDGELILGDPKDKHCFNMTTSAVMSEEHEYEMEVNFHVFDCYTATGKPFAERLAHASKLCKGQPNIKVVGHTLIHSAAELERYEEKHVMLGYEGVMLRDPQGPYKPGRSTQREGWLLKMKRFEDSEAVVLGMVEELRNTNEKTQDALGRGKRSSHKAGKQGKGRMGALWVRDIHSGVEFSVGSGFTEEQREQWWSAELKVVGRVIKYRHQPAGKLEAPRFPVFIGERKDLP